MAEIKLPEITIIRNGIQIDLDYKEMRDIYRKMDLYYSAEEVCEYYENEMDEECPLTSDECYKIADMALDAMADATDAYCDRVECFLYCTRQFMREKENGN